VLTPPLRWKDDDAFDTLGRRVASVARWAPSVPTGVGEHRPDSFWQAYVANENVWFDGKERFESRERAQAAAEWGYRERVIFAAGDPSAIPASRAARRGGGGLRPSVVARDVVSYPVVVARKVRRRLSGVDQGRGQEPDWDAPPQRAEPPRVAVPVNRTADPVSRAPGLLGNLVQSRRR
jgi:hypothetical protein